jgi:hypothetical protein
MAAREQVTFSNIAATTAAFALGGGLYVSDVKATFGGGNVALQRIMPDASTYVTVITAQTADGASSATYLPPGQYKYLITTATAVYIALTRIPQE